MSSRSSTIERELLNIGADEARGRFERMRARFETAPSHLDFPDVLSVSQEGREVEVLVERSGDEVLARIHELKPEETHREALSLEDIFLATASKVGGQMR